MARGDSYYPRLGEQITRLVQSLVAVKGWSRTFAMNYVGRQTGYSPDMIHRWRQGRSRPSDETLETLAQIGKDEAGLDRAWGESLLRAAQYPHAMATVDDLWGLREIRSIPCNLPPLGPTAFVGRQHELSELLNFLSPEVGAHIINVDGIGGVGKTTLALVAAHLCRKASTGEDRTSKAPTFDAIVFFSAKQETLTPIGILPTGQVQRTLRDLFRVIAQTLESFDITLVPMEEQATKVRTALAGRNVLLVVDNLETMEDKHDIISFLFLLPPSVKVVITTRERAYAFSPLRLRELPKEEALRLIFNEARRHDVVLSDEGALKLYQGIGGVPAALVYAIGLIAVGSSVRKVLDRVRGTTGDVARFCFRASVESLRGRNAHLLLMSVAMFPGPPVLLALAHVTGLTDDLEAVKEEEMEQLRMLSLVNQLEDEKEGKYGVRYEMLPLTREYALAELAAHPAFERAARERWVRWYLDLARDYGGDDWEEWHVGYDHMEKEWQNLLDVFVWCAQHEQYAELCTFWLPKGVSGGVLEFASLYGHWDDRLIWLDWLIREAERRGDWDNAVEAMSRRGFTLTLMGQLAQAHEILDRAWKFHKRTENRVQVILAQNLGILRIHEGNYSEAHHWLDQAEALLDQAQLEERDSARWRINAQYWRGILYYEQGHYDQAKMCFEKAIEHGQAISWQRSTIYAQNYLAEIAIVQDRLDEAETLLQRGRVVAELNNDRRRTAHYQSSLARLCQQQGKLDEAYHWAGESLNAFRRLGMQKEIGKMEVFLKESRE